MINTGSLDSNKILTFFFNFGSIFTALGSPVKRKPKFEANLDFVRIQMVLKTAFLIAVHSQRRSHIYIFLFCTCINFKIKVGQIESEIFAFLVVALFVTI